MHKHELLKAVIKSETYKRVPWVISAFSIIQESPDEWRNDPYPYRIVQTPISNYFVNPNSGELEAIEGCAVGSPVYTFKERIVLNIGDVGNVISDNTETTVGNTLFNQICLADSFGTKIPFMKGKVSISKLESIIEETLTDTPAENTERRQDVIYVDEYIKFVNSVFELTNFSQLCAWSLTEKIILPPPGLKEFKKKIIEENKNRLHDASVIAEIEKKLVAFDAEFLKGDPGAENFLLGSKPKQTVRKKLFLDYGTERGFEDAVKVDFIANSLLEGWDIEKFATLNNALRSGSFDRGSETQLGGVAFKEILRSTSNISILEEDCGSKIGRPVLVSKENFKHLRRFTIIKDNGDLEYIDKDSQLEPYLGTIVQKRSMMYCTLDGNKFCKTCAGFNLGSNPFGASMAAAQFGSTFLALFLSSMHSKVLATKHLNIKTAFT